MIFLSQRPNLDPEPYVTPQGVRSPFPIHGRSALDPRPEYTQTNDPEPWITFKSLYHTDRYRYDTNVNNVLEWSPRHEQYDTPVNPILYSLRLYMETQSGSDFGLAYWSQNWLDNLQPGMGMVTHAESWGHAPEHIEHARRVLSKLAVLS